MRLSNVLRVGILKTIYYNFKFCKLSDALHFPIVVARNASIRGGSKAISFSETPGMGEVTLGFNRDFNSRAPSTITVYGKILFRGKSHHAFGAGCLVLVNTGAELEIGDNFGCTGDSRIFCYKRIVVGRNNLWSFGCTVMDTDIHQIIDKTKRIVNCEKPVVFGDNILMACNCTILKGVIIPNSTIIAACSLITQSKTIINQGSIIAQGGRVIKSCVKWQ